ncbi:MAG: hypothetical protein C4540_06480 [Candidatus Omnitrophota bacterium]|jgi:ABC-2 type transport system permease protein|nr:MAG: hypothetical protein C4540_06480 [Candidatus Omnitrophota bacterium]
MCYLLKTIIDRRSLIRELVCKDLKLRYARSRLGFLWLFLSPLLLVGIFYVVFYKFLQVRTEEMPFLLYLMSAVFPWMFFQNSLNSAITSLCDNRNLIRESGFPHYLIPLSVVLVNFIQFLPSLLILLVSSAFMRGGLPILAILLPVVLVMHFAMTLGFAILSSLLYVKARDIKYIIEMCLILLFYLTPVFYPLTLVESSLSPELFKLYMLNPFVGLISLYRVTGVKGGYYSVARFLDIQTLVLVPLFFTVFILLCSFLYYRKNKRSINDRLFY